MEPPIIATDKQNRAISFAVSHITCNAIMKVENNLPVVYLSIVLPIGTLRPFCSSAEVLPLCLCLLGLVDMATGSCGSMCGCTGHGIVTISRVACLDLVDGKPLASDVVRGSVWWSQ